METLIVVVHVIAAIAIVGLVLLQQGKGADAGAAFGSGSSQTVFGASGSGNFLTKSTTVAAVIFFATSLVLAIYAKQYSIGAGAEDGAPLVNPELLREMEQQSDIPQVSAPVDSSDIPAVPESEPQ
ncbi:preprotein translocase subunit SecG [Pseudohongiella sp. SYSU M77423]|uniref:preprotein translocase subunit SecG n=1 Tax=unclassified Pseudohongiella TaxID=2629611 RepID=UPI000C8E7BEC|nr:MULTISPECIES: preprotein translocase subunit SecG [unclassified Pseudohongiella]MAO40614.1 preprotein translocase subunit SecG [Pseudohongiella sp.]MDH7943935.1 preprotein translocase subunit SecG [Pseudohongiella sp. SYSU M77423]HBX40623.1 preprotein translocase subunit SecG [Marinobacter adhaerens]|tara:strand:+ start:2710 stop:3087 length:378 start_codon:yes stop_codon:yes gene_type:complete